MDDLRAFIGVNFVIGYHKLPNLRYSWERGRPSLSVNFVASVMTKEWLKEILGNLHFLNNEDVVSRDHQAHDKAFKVRWLIDHLNKCFRIWYRCAPKTGYLYESDIYIGRKETAETGLGESVVLQLTEKPNGSFCRIFFDNFITLPLLLRKLADNSLYSIGVVRQNQKLLPKIEKPTKK